MVLVVGSCWYRSCPLVLLPYSVPGTTEFIICSSRVRCDDYSNFFYLAPPSFIFCSVLQESPQEGPAKDTATKDVVNLPLPTNEARDATFNLVLVVLFDGWSCWYCWHDNIVFLRVLLLR